jgi:hypothetical protein
MFTNIKGTPDYETDTLYATYKRTINGYAHYYVHNKTIPKSKRTMSTAVSVGGITIKGTKYHETNSH